MAAFSTQAFDTKAFSIFAFSFVTSPTTVEVDALSPIVRCAAFSGNIHKGVCMGEEVTATVEMGVPVVNAVGFE